MSGLALQILVILLIGAVSGVMGWRLRGRRLRETAGAGLRQRPAKMEPHAAEVQAEPETPQAQPADVAPTSWSGETRPAARVPLRGNGKARLRSRTAFCQDLRRRIDGASPGDPGFSIVLVRVDKFDQIIARHGRHAGEAVESATGELAASVAQPEDLTAHYGPGTVALLRFGDRLPEAVRLANDLHQAAARLALPTDGSTPPVTLSVGIAELNQPAGGLTGLLEQAEAALRTAKGHGGNCTSYHDGKRCQLVAQRVDAGSPLLPSFAHAFQPASGHHSAACP